MHIVYKITFNRYKENNILPYYYIGSKSNCSYKDGIIIDKRGNPYYGSSKYKNYNKIVSDEIDFITVEILHETDSYDEALLLEKNLHIENNVVLSPEFFNQSVATCNTYTNPEYKTMRNILSGKTARLLESEINDDWVGITHGSKWYNNGIVNKMFDQNELVPEGWIKGRINCKSNPNNFYAKGKEAAIKKGVETRKANGNYVPYNKGTVGLYKHSQATLEKLKLRPKPAGDKNGMYGKIFITDGNINKTINKDKCIPVGWKRGMTRKAKIINTEI